MRDLKRWMFLSLAVVAATVGVAACGGSSKSSSSSGSSSPSSKSTTHGTPIKIGLIASGTGVTAEPDVQQAALIGLHAINAAGGVQGHPVSLDYCDDQGSVQTAAVCAQKLLVQDKDLMLVGNDGTYDTGVAPVLASAHTILFSPEGASVPDWTSPNVFMIQVEDANYNVLPSLLPPGHHKVADFVADIAVALTGAKASIPFYTKLGDSDKIIPIPLTASDFSTPCLQAKNAGADVGVVTFNALTQFAPMAQACKSLGVNLTWAMEGSVISPSVLQAINSLHLKAVIASPFSEKTFTDLAADQAKYGPTDSNFYSDAGVDAYIGFKLLPSVLTAAGTTTDAEKIKSYLESQTAFNTDGYTPPVNFSPSNHYGPFPALKNTCMYKYSLQGTKLVPLSSTPVCLPASGKP